MIKIKKVKYSQIKRKLKNMTKENQNHHTERTHSKKSQTYEPTFRLLFDVLFPYNNWENRILSCDKSFVLN